MCKNRMILFKGMDCQGRIFLFEKRRNAKGILDRELHKIVKQNFVTSCEYEPAPNDSNLRRIFEIYANM